MKLSFLIIIIGFVAEFRILNGFFKEKIIENHQKKKFIVVSAAFYGLILFFFINSPLFIWFLVILVNFLSLFIPLTIKNRRKNKFRESTIEFLDVVIGLLKSGRSFRETLNIIRTQNRSYLMNEIIDAVLIEQEAVKMSSDRFVRSFYLEILALYRSQHRLLEKTMSLRKTLRTSFWFYRKNRQLLLQSRVQSIIMSIFYIAIAAYLIVQREFSKNIDIFLVSLALFLIGTFWIWKMGENYRWKE